MAQELAHAASRQASRLCLPRARRLVTLRAPASRGSLVCKATGEGGERGRRTQGLIYTNKGDATAPKFPLDVPFLPFTSEEVLTPGSVKTLHLYEARYLALLEEVLASSHQLFAHVVVEQPLRPASSAAARYPGAFVGENFVLLMATMVKVLDVRAAEIGAVVRVQGEGRVRVADVYQAQPYITGRVESMMDRPLAVEEVLLVRQRMEQLKEVMRDVQNLSMKFKTKETTNLQQAMYWAERQPLIPGIHQPDFLQQQAAAAAASDAIEEASSSSSRGDPTSPLSSSSSSSSSRKGTLEQLPEDQESGSSQEPGLVELSEQAHRLSFAALQLVPQSSEKEEMQLARKKVAAMETDSSLERLELSLEAMTAARALLAAKCALKSLNIGAS